MATFTDVDWRNYLDAQITERQPRLDLYDRYYDGDHRLAFATSKFKEAFGELFEAFATNWCGLVVDVCAERLRPIGFRFGDEPDDDAWTVWQENSLDALSLQAHTEAIKSEVAYLLVTPGPNGPHITPELASQCFVATDPSDPLNRLAAIKKYVDSNGDMVSVVWTPDTITTWRRNGVATRLQGFGLDIPAGVADWGNGRTVENVLGRVPMIPLENSPKLGKGGRSDLRPAISLNDAANKFFTDMIHASEFTAFPQRVLTGVEIPRDPTTGEVLPAAQLKAAVALQAVFLDQQPGRPREVEDDERRGHLGRPGEPEPDRRQPVADEQGRDRRPVGAARRGGWLHPAGDQPDAEVAQAGVGRGGPSHGSRR
jgi:hypothetical protein